MLRKLEAQETELLRKIYEEARKHVRTVDPHKHRDPEDSPAVRKLTKQRKRAKELSSVLTYRLAAAALDNTGDKRTAGYLNSVKATFPNGTKVRQMQVTDCVYIMEQTKVGSIPETSRQWDTLLQCLKRQEEELAEAALRVIEEEAGVLRTKKLYSLWRQQNFKQFRLLALTPEEDRDSTGPVPLDVMAKQFVDEVPQLSFERHGQTLNDTKPWTVPNRYADAELDRPIHRILEVKQTDSGAWRQGERVVYRLVVRCWA
jgi:hypothetical protein